MQNFINKQRKKIDITPNIKLARGVHHHHQVHLYARETPQSLYLKKVYKRALRNLKLMQAKEHYNNLSFFSNAFRKHKEMEREKKHKDEMKYRERLAIKIMHITGKSADKLLTCSTNQSNQKLEKKSTKIKSKRRNLDKGIVLKKSVKIAADNLSNDKIVQTTKFQNTPETIFRNHPIKHSKKDGTQKQVFTVAKKYFTPTNKIKGILKSRNPLFKPFGY